MAAETSQQERQARVASIIRLLLRKGEFDIDDTHPLFHSGLTIPQMRVLFVAARRVGARPGVISERTRMAPPNVTSVLDRLVERNLVRREPDPEDGRATIVLLTNDGKRIVREIGSAFGERIEAALSGMSDDELAALQEGMRALVREISARQAPRVEE
ncbi:MAG: MarR family transcriptional regulator [Dehalococcoidia bacterium]